MDKRLLVNTAHVRGHGTNIGGELAPQVFEIDKVDRLRSSSPLHYSLHVRIVEQSLLVQGTLECNLQCECDRCLCEYDQSIEINNVCHYFEIPGDKIVDITDEIREDILIMFPQKYLCSAECMGLCPSCGRNRNAEDCQCENNESVVDVWSQLNELEL